MKKGEDIALRFPGLFLVHHNLPGKEVELHSHDEHLLFMPLSGEIAVETDREQFRAGPGRSIYLPPATCHRFHSSRSQGERLIAMITFRAWRQAGAGRLSARVGVSSQLCKEILFYLLLNPKTRAASPLVGVFVQALSEGLQWAEQGGGLSHLAAKARDPRLENALELLTSQLDREISMERVARASGLSVRSLSRLCLGELGVSPHRIRVRARIEKAQEILSSGRLDVTQTAYEVGYRSMSQFIAAFRQVTGQLPSEVARFGRKPSGLGRSP